MDLKETLRIKLQDDLILHKVVKGGDGMAFLAGRMQQHRSSREALGTAPMIKLWTLGVSEKFTTGKSHLYMVYTATGPSPQISPPPASWDENGGSESYRPGRNNGAVSFLEALENIVHSFILGQVLCSVLEINR